MQTDTVEEVDILIPPLFVKSGIVKSRTEAFNAGDWIGTFNLWIIQSQPIPAILYQQRSSNSTWEPNKLDVSAGGHFTAGESIYDGLREVREELGRDYQTESLTSVGRKLYVGPDARGKERRNIVDIFFVTDNSPIESFLLEKNEVFALFSCPIAQLIAVHEANMPFTAHGCTNAGDTISLNVTKDSFPINWDNYHYKIALLAKRYLNGELHLVY